MTRFNSQEFKPTIWHGDTEYARKSTPPDSCCHIVRSTPRSFLCGHLHFGLGTSVTGYILDWYGDCHYAWP